jgi:uncharacterized protein
MPIALIALALIVLVIFGPQLWVRHTLKKYHKPNDRYRGTGAELARLLLDLEGLHHVRVEKTENGDHYDPTEKAVRLSPECYEARSLTAITVSAHEVGHALQDRDQDPRLSTRTALAIVMSKIQPLSVGFIFIGSIAATAMGSPRLLALTVLLAFGLQLLSTVLNAITLPLEWNASFGRALPLLRTHHILIEGDERHASRILTAAALTYVAASLVSALFLLRWVR